MFMVVLDEEDEIVSKHKASHYLPAGEHEQTRHEADEPVDLLGPLGGHQRPMRLARGRQVHLRQLGEDGPGAIIDGGAGGHVSP